MRQIRQFIDGVFCDAASGRRFAQVAPATGRVVGRVQEAGRDDVDRAVTAARRALEGPWGRLSVEERCRLLYRVADGINARADEFLAAESEDTGKP